MENVIKETPALKKVVNVYMKRDLNVFIPR
jgi:hypothetical protein